MYREGGLILTVLFCRALGLGNINLLPDLLREEQKNTIMLALRW